MPHDRSEVHLAADLSAPAGRELEGDAFRIAIFGDFSGGAAAGTPLAKRRAWRVDRDDVDSVLSRLAPSVRIALDPSEPPLAVTFAAIDDFHPDRLLRRLPLFQRLLALRNEAATGGQAPAPAPPPRRAQQPDAVALDLATGSLLDQIVGGAPADANAPASTRQSAPPDDLADFVARAVRPHTVGEATPQQRELVAKIDDVITATLRVLLHHPRFQALESLWRGIDFLVRRLETSESMQVFLVDASRDEIVADLSGADVARSGLHQLLVDAAGRQSEPAWSLLVGSYTFEPGDVEVLAKLAAIGRSAGAPWVAGGHARFLGIESFAGTDSDDWTPDRSAGWAALRASAVAPFLALASPRFLLRVPYGRRGEECEVLRFEELGDGAWEHESFLWGNPSIACALAIGSNVAAGDSPASRSALERLPLYVAPVDGESTAMPCAEAVLTQSALEEMLDAGLTALVSPREADELVIPRIQSVAAPLRSLSIRSPMA